MRGRKSRRCSTPRHPGHEFRCWIPVGTPENRAALEANQRAGNDVGDGDDRERLTWPGAEPHTSDPPDEALLRIEDLVVEFPVGRSGLKVHAVSNVSLDVKPGETLGLVGESGLRQEHDRAAP